MKSLPVGMQSDLDGGVTTLCWCWRLTRRDGQVLGFTDHDRDIVFDGVVFEAASGFTASEIVESVGLSVDDLEVESALSSGGLREDDLVAGDYDDARVEIFRVDWSDPAKRALMRTGSIGEVTRSRHTFRAEVRGLAHYLQQPKGRLFQYLCDADLGDTRCTVDLSAAAFRASGSISQIHSASEFDVTGLGAFADDWFTRGLFRFDDGVNANRSIEIKRHRLIDGVISINLWHDAVHVPAANDRFTVTAGCDKHIETCKLKFANAINFRGFPHMPGTDFLTKFVRTTGSR